MLEWLGFTLKVAYDGYKQFKRGQNTVDIEKYPDQIAIKRVEKSAGVIKIKTYIHKPYDSQYEEYVKHSIPRFFKVFEWINHTCILSR